MREKERILKRKKVKKKGVGEKLCIWKLPQKKMSFQALSNSNKLPSQNLYYCIAVRWYSVDMVMTCLETSLGGVLKLLCHFRGALIYS